MIYQAYINASPRRGAGLSSSMKRLAVLALLGMAACASTNPSAPNYPFSDDAYQLPVGSVQPGDIQHLSNGSLIW
jgi:uncharacterized lipoprotein YmbA